MAFRRVDTDDVTEIMDTDISDLEAFIRAAHEFLVSEVQPEGNLTEDRLRSIEKFLAAGLAHSKDPRILEETTGDASVRYQGSASEGLASNRYGQMAMFLDSTGVLASQAARSQSSGGATPFKFDVQP